MDGMDGMGAMGEMVGTGVRVTTGRMAETVVSGRKDRVGLRDTRDPRETRDAEEIPASLEYKVPRAPRSRPASKDPMVTRARQVCKGCMMKEIRNEVVVASGTYLE
ncbi:Uncharacterized protein TPAR_05426 [Tolypocladium paradoxum]|uniref:Uncharacterized protein n=1 Tax=Tolypocladium paradoxum TaxID=94208 RepID=A0A2S4KW49_9HYPO|nr:Uncharacterized protein TPAR_05426 [Tolypocladium paradoxum]